MKLDLPPVFSVSVGLVHYSGQRTYVHVKISEPGLQQPVTLRRAFQDDVALSEAVQELTQALTAWATHGVFGLAEAGWV